MKTKLGFLIRVSLAAGLGIIFARQSGKKTRNAIRRTAMGVNYQSARETKSICLLRGHS